MFESIVTSSLRTASVHCKTCIRPWTAYFDMRSVREHVILVNINSRLVETSALSLVSSSMVVGTV